MASALTESLPDLWKETYDLVAQVPEGMVTTYGEVAKALGDIVASRFVGLAMSRNDDIVRVPCRRVVQSDGSLGGYTGGGPLKKARLLRKEGIRVSGGKVQEFERVLFRDFDSSHPLRALRSRQRALRRRLVLEDSFDDASAVAGVDVAYSGDRTFSAIVTVEGKTGRILGRSVEEGTAKFPYIPTYLAFREVPLVSSLLDEVEAGTVIMYDGNGILHPEQFGIASHFGVASGIPTIGVAKKLLCGRIGGNPRSLVRPVVGEGGLIGHALSRASGANPVYVSAGHRISPETALRTSRRLLMHRVPEPTRLAHIEAEAARRLRTNK